MKAHDPRAALDRLIELHGLTHAARALHQLSRPAIRLLPRLVQGAEAPPGATRLGGLPDLPAGQAWPTWRGRSLAFLAQLRLSEVGHHDTRHLLPGRGLVQVFYDLEDLPEGQDPTDRGGLRVLFQPDERVVLARAAAPERKPPRVLPAALVELAPEPSMPPEESHEAQVLELDSDDWDRYFELLTSLEVPEVGGDRARHKLLGYGDPLQGDMRLDCQLVTHGLDLRQEGAFRSSKAAELDKGLSEWQLLLQLDSDPRLELELGPGGRLYVMVRLAHLRAGRLEEAWAIRQESC